MWPFSPPLPGRGTLQDQDSGGWWVALCGGVGGAPAKMQLGLPDLAWRQGGLCEGPQHPTSPSWLLGSPTPVSSSSFWDADPPQEAASWPSPPGVLLLAVASVLVWDTSCMWALEDPLP